MLIWSVKNKPWGQNVDLKDHFSNEVYMTHCHTNYAKILLRNISCMYVQSNLEKHCMYACTVNISKIYRYFCINFKIILSYYLHIFLKINLLKTWKLSVSVAKGKIHRGNS